MRLWLTGLLLLGLSACASGSPTAEQDLVDRSTLTVQGMMTAREGRDARPLLQRAFGVLVCPQLFKAGFVFGGSGGECVLSGRGPNGWSNPAFYQLSSGSFGLQAGIQDSELMLIVLSQRGLQAIIDDQFKIGGAAQLAFATLGTGVEGATTAALHADVVAFARSRGLFAGLSLDGSLISVNSAWNAAFYARPIGAQELVLEGQGNNPGAAPLREMLARFSGPG
jgi:lipid-binding SYLF domain-containing protein